MLFLFFRFYFHPKRLDMQHYFFLIFSSFDYLLSVPLFCLLHVLIRYNSRVNILFPHFSSRSLLIYSLSDATALHPPTFESCRVSILRRPKLYE